MRAVIDRFEGDVAVLELDDGKSFADVDRSMLPEGARARATPWLARRALGSSTNARPGRT